MLNRTILRAWFKQRLNNAVLYIEVCSNLRRLYAIEWLTTKEKFTNVIQYEWCVIKCVHPIQVLHYFSYVHLSLFDASISKTLSNTCFCEHCIRLKVWNFVCLFKFMQIPFGHRMQMHLCIFGNCCLLYSTIWAPVDS